MTCLHDIRHGLRVVLILAAFLSGVSAVYGQPPVQGVDSMAVDSAALAYKSRGVSCYLNGKLDSAILVTKKALSLWAGIGRKAPVANACQNLGTFYRESLQLDSAIYFYQEIFKYVEPDHPFGKTAYVLIADIYEMLNNLVKAREYYLEGAMVSLSDRDTLNFVYLHDLYAHTFIGYDRNTALENLQKTERIYELLLPGKNLPALIQDYANNLNNQGVIYEYDGEMEKALGYYRRSFQVRDRYDQYLNKNRLQTDEGFSRDHLKAKFLFYNNSANIYAELPDFARAEEHHDMAEMTLEQIRKKVPNGYRELMVDHLLTRAHLDKCLNRFETIEPIFREIFAILIPDYDPGGIPLFPEDTQMEQARDREGMLRVLLQWCNYWKADEVDPSETFRRTLPAYKLADYLVDLMMESQDSRKALRFWREEIMPFYKSAFDIAALQGDLEHAFYFSEKSKALLLLAERIASRSFNTLDPLSRDKLDCRRMIDSLELELKKPGVSTAQRESAEMEMKSILEACNPLFFRESKGVYRKLSDYILNLHQVQTRLEEDQAVVEFFDGWDQGYGILISKDTVLLRVLPVAGARDSLMVQLSGQIYAPIRGDNDIEATNETLGLLYDHLIRPFEDAAGSSDRLVIVPTGALFRVPFAALVRTNPSGPGSYLAEHFAIQTVYSLTFLYESISSEPDAQTEVMAMAPAFDKGSLASNQAQTLQMRGSLAPLIFSEAEVSGISRHVSTQRIIGGDDLKAYFLDHAHDFQCVALSTHGKANNLDGMQSFVAFGPDSTEWLYAGEIYSKSIPLNLLTLSACETAVGNYETGEGVISMSYAFRQAGVASLVTTLWSVNDRASSELMIWFYEGLASGLTKDRALSRSQRKYLRHAKSEESHPFFWAGFTLIGDASPIELPSPDPIGWWWIPFAVLIPGLAYVLWKRKGS